MSFIRRQFLRGFFMAFGITLLSYAYGEWAKLFEARRTGPHISPDFSLTGYLSYMGRLLHGDLGQTLSDGESVLHAFFSRLPATLELMILAVILAWVVGLPLAIRAARYPLGWVDRSIQLLGSVTYSLPVFWLGMILLMVFATGLQWLPVGGSQALVYDITPITGFSLIDAPLSEHHFAAEAFFDAVAHLILPLVTLAVLPTAFVALQMRASLERVYQQPYLLAAQSRGLSRRKLIWVHAIPNALLPVIDALSLQFSMLITSTVIVEYLFGWPGIGVWFLDLIEQRDFGALRGTIVLLALMILLINTANNFLRFAVSPKVRR